MHEDRRAAHPKPLDEAGQKAYEARSQRRADTAFQLGLGAPLSSLRPESRAELDDEGFSEDLEDALLLIAHQWFPSSLSDIHALPEGVVSILPSIRKGMSVRRARPVGKGTIGTDEVT